MTVKKKATSAVPTPVRNFYLFHNGSEMAVYSGMDDVLNDGFGLGDEVYEVVVVAIHTIEAVRKEV